MSLDTEINNNKFNFETEITELGLLKAREYVDSNFLTKLSENLTYHGTKHTKVVSATAMILVKQEGLEDREQHLMGLAGLFHDVGYLEKYPCNEPIGARKAEEYMIELDYTKEEINIVTTAILNTDMKKEPETIYEKILRDADLAILGFKGFERWSSNLREEWKHYSNDSPLNADDLNNNVSWLELQLGFIGSHVWFTESAKKLYEPTKKENIELFEKNLENAKNS